MTFFRARVMLRDAYWIANAVFQQLRKLLSCVIPPRSATFFSPVWVTTEHEGSAIPNALEGAPSGTVRAHQRQVPMDSTLGGKTARVRIYSSF